MEWRGGIAYMGAMSPLNAVLIFLATVLGMELFAYAAHRWIMHGPGWFLHESHHRPRTGNWELNDLYAAIFAVPSFVLLLGGVQLGWWPGFTWIGRGSPPTARSISASTTSSCTSASATAISRAPAT